MADAQQDRPTPAPSPGDLLRRLAIRAGRELEHGDLPLPDGDTLRVTSVPEVEAWLQGWAIRLDAGEDA